MLDLGLRRSRRDDAFLGEARAYRAAWRRCRDDAGRARLAARMPEVAAALAIRDGDRRVRLAVEGRLLAGLATGAIAARLGLGEPAVERFERLFFHVADRLGARGYVVHQVIGRGRFPIPGPPDAEKLVWAFAYFGGARVLEALEVSPEFAALCAGDEAGPRFGPGFGPGPVGLAVAAMGLDVSGGSRSEAMLLLRLEASERRYQARGAGTTPTIAPAAGVSPEARAELTEALILGDDAPHVRETLDESGLAAALPPAGSGDHPDTQGDESASSAEVGSVPAWGLVA